MSNVLTFVDDRKLGLSLCIREQKTNQRVYVQVDLSELKAPFSHSKGKFDKKDLFIPTGENKTTYLPNNLLLSQMLEKYQAVINQFPNLSPKEIKGYFDTRSDLTPKELPSFIDFVAYVIDKWRKEVASSNYQLYTTFQNVLKESKLPFQYKPINEVTNEDFETFAIWILEDRKGVNYINLCKRFKAVVNREDFKEHNKNEFTYKYQRSKPVEVIDKSSNASTLLQRVKNNITYLSENQVKAFIDMDLSKFNVKNAELYRDYCLFLYYSSARPIDVSTFNKYRLTEGNLYVYLPQKMKRFAGIKGKEEKHVAIRPLPKEAMEIIKKYGFKKEYNYHLFPFLFNKTPWNDLDPVEYQEHYTKITRQQDKINKFLKLIGKELNLTFPLQLYCFRHSIITNTIANGSRNIRDVAFMAGTSEDMVNTHYYNPTASIENIQNATRKITKAS